MQAVCSYQRSSWSKPDQGLLCSRIEVLEADGSPVMTLSALNMIRRRLDAAELTAHPPGDNDQHGHGHRTLAQAACPVPLWAESSQWEPQAEAGMRNLVGILAAGPAFFVSAWVLMLFAGVVDIDVGIRPFGYITSMIVTIALWLTVAPVIGSISRMGRKG